MLPNLVPVARVEPIDKPAGDSQRAQHHRHSAGEIFAMAALKIEEEGFRGKRVSEVQINRRVAELPVHMAWLFFMVWERIKISGAVILVCL